MEELEQLILKKIDIYKTFYIVADEMDRKADCKYYGKQLKKLNKMLKIL